MRKDLEHRDPHAWVRRRLAAWRSGLLPDEDSLSVASHLETCPDCKDLAETFPRSAGAHPEAHIPASVIAEWKQAQTGLRGLERALVRRHLERCEACRQDLELLGHAPVLERIPALESNAVLAPVATPPLGAAREVAGAVDGAGAPAATPSPAQTVIRVVRTAPRVRWWDRALVGWSSLATAAAIVAVVVHLRRPFVEGVPSPVVAISPAPVAAPPAPREETPSGPALRIVPNRARCRDRRAGRSVESSRSSRWSDRSTICRSRSVRSTCRTRRW